MKPPMNADAEFDAIHPLITKCISMRSTDLDLSRLLQETLIGAYRRPSAVPSYLRFRPNYPRNHPSLTVASVLVALVASRGKKGLGMAIAHVGALDLYYEEHGSGDPLLLIMGLAADSMAWLFQIPDFSTHY
jgi:hypothetical protein